ncbi:MAG: protein arginine kinase [Lentisphaerae bacterium]|nr:protein arginine kinase [Lentisphaerota bacterium]
MNSNIDALFEQGGAWLAPDSTADIAVSSRIRLARNIEGELFPGKATDSDKERMWTELSLTLQSLPEFKNGCLFDMAELSRVEKEILFERHLVSRELVSKSKGSGVITRYDESLSAMINEEDHIRFQAMSPGMTLVDLWKRIDSVDTSAETLLRYAYSEELGYLTACPTNVGTGLRASVMLHLPGLMLMNEIGPVLEGVSKIGLAVRGLWGEGTEMAGNMLQISNQITIGDSELNIIKRLEQVVLEVIEHERNARERVLEKKANVSKDFVNRSIGILTHAYLLNSREVLDMLSAVRFGIEQNMVSEWEKPLINELFLMTQPGHLQKIYGKNLGAKRRDEYRAKMIQNKLKSGRKEKPQ